MFQKRWKQDKQTSRPRTDYYERPFPRKEFGKIVWGNELLTATITCREHAITNFFSPTEEGYLKAQEWIQNLVKRGY